MEKITDKLSKMQGFFGQLTKKDILTDADLENYNRDYQCGYIDALFNFRLISFQLHQELEREILKNHE